MASEERAVSPDEAFRLLGDETRVAILRAVWEAPVDGLSFSEIRNRIGTPDSGQFNYHLGKLKGHFLTSDDGGYRLTQAGRELIRAVLAGTITDRPEAVPTPIGGACVDCGGELIARYDEYGIIECEDCERVVMWNEFPPAGLAGRTAEEFATAFDRWTVSRFRLATEGICPNCASEMTLTSPNTEEETDFASHHRCTNCKYEARVPLFGHVVFHPAVISFYYEHGIDVTELPYWRLKELAQAGSERVVSDQPWIFEVVVSHDRETITLRLDSNFEVVKIVS